MRDRHKANTNNNHLTLEGFQLNLYNHLSLEGYKHHFHNHLTLEVYQHNHLSLEGCHKEWKVYNLVVSLNHKPLLSHKTMIVIDRIDR